MNTSFLFKNAQIASEDSPKLFPSDVWVENGKIRAMDQCIEEVPGAEVMDCSGKVLLPALFDAHVHFREPGQEAKETIETGSRAALNGGITGALTMPNTDPAIDTGGLVRFVQNLAKEKASIPIYTSGCITKNRAGKSLAEIADMLGNGAVMITDDGSPVENPYVLRRALEYAKNFDLPLASHCEIPSLSADGAMNEGMVSYKLGIPAIPACSEEICIDRDIRLAQFVGARIHIQHVSSARGMEIIRRFKEEGVNVTCEVSPHHLIFCEEDIQDYDTHYKMNPPLRTKEDNERLLEGLIEGVFDIIATDHAPHTSAEKAQDFTSAPFGIIGLDTALLSLFTSFIKPGKFGWDLLIQRYSSAPRRLLNLPPVPIKEGGIAEFILFNTKAKTHITRDFLKSKSENTPYLNQTLNGHVEWVFIGQRLLKN